jgi:hypothetical protein
MMKDNSVESMFAKYITKLRNSYYLEMVYIYLIPPNIQEVIFLFVCLDFV